MTKLNLLKTFIQIGGDSRSGGSLLARLFDGHPSVLSYPFENEFFRNRNESLAGFDKFRKTADFQHIELEEVVSKIIKFGKGVLQTKQRYADGEIQFDDEKFLKDLRQSVNITDNDLEIYSKIHNCFFDLYLQTKVADSLAVSNHCSRTFVGDLEKFFSVFMDSYFLHTIREPKANCASLKNYSFFATGKNPEFIPEQFIDLVIKRWLIAAYVAVKNQEQFGDKYIIVMYEKLVLGAESELKKICANIKLEFDEEMLVPKFGKQVWGGNSSFGKLPASVSAQNLEKYKEVLSEDEQNKVDDFLLEIYEALSKNEPCKELINSKYAILTDGESDLVSLNQTELRDVFNEVYSEMRRIQIA